MGRSSPISTLPRAARLGGGVRSPHGGRVPARRGARGRAAGDEVRHSAGETAAAPGMSRVRLPDGPRLVRKRPLPVLPRNSNLKEAPLSGRRRVLCLSRGHGLARTAVDRHPVHLRPRARGDQPVLSRGMRRPMIESKSPWNGLVLPRFTSHVRGRKPLFRPLGTENQHEKSG